MTARPTPLQWLRYAYGGRLPEGLREWVRHDLTDADWRWREVLRVCVQLAVPVLVFAVLPLAGDIKGFAIALMVLSALFVAGAYGDDLRDRRLRQHDLDRPS
ncbi:MAG TPA: DUF5313 family protein [Mycobacteriales bacterium]|nr:DUF5313 family protein [Mycobacteriales bacterium]